MQVRVDSEVGRLCSVLLGSVQTFRLHEPINTTQRYYYVNDPPEPKLLLEQQGRFTQILEDHDVDVYWVEPRLDSPNQLNTRDVATVIGETLVITEMKEKVRQNESLALSGILQHVSTPVLRVSAGIVEGGDILIDRDVLHVGLSERTDTTGFNWLNSTFSDRFQVIPLKLHPPFLHLDVVCNLISQGLALVYAPGLYASAFRELARRYELVEVTLEEQKRLATNVLSLSPTEIISDSRNSRVNSIMRSYGLDVIETDFNEIAKIGGAFRCGTCPLIREPIAAA